MSAANRKSHWWMQRMALELGFRCVYPVLARLPARLGLAGAQLWGRAMAGLDCEWRSLALRQHFVVDKTHAALSMVLPHLTTDQIKVSVRERFECAAKEELEGHWLAYGLKDYLPVRIVGLDAIRETMAKGRGLVLLTFHFDAAIWGIACLGRAGLRLSPISSNVVEDGRVPPPIRAYFRAKYAGLSQHLNGGRVMHRETSMREFYRRLARGEGVVVLADAYRHNARHSSMVDFLGQRRAFDDGALRLAEKTGAAIAAFVCLRENVGYRIEISPPRGLTGKVEEEFRETLAFLEEKIRTHPARWWAADLLPDFPIVH